MKIFGFVIKKEQKNAKIEETYDFRQELKEVKLEHEKAVLEEKLKTIKKQQEYEQTLLDYKIKDQQAKIDEEFSNLPEGFEDAIEDNIEDVPAWLKPIIPSIISKFTNNSNIPPQNITPLNNNTEIGGDMSLSNDEIQAIKETTPKADLLTLKNLPDGQIKSVIRSRYPKITEECLERAIIILKR
jgi:hypothetical protein